MIEVPLPQQSVRKMIRLLNFGEDGTSGKAVSNSWQNR